MNGICAKCGVNPSNHQIGNRLLCCACYVEEGNPPADWHKECMRAYAKERLPSVDVDDYAFAVRNRLTGGIMKIYHDGQIEGFPPGFTIITNRIPGLVNRAAELGYLEAVSRIDDARQQLYQSMIGDLHPEKEDD